ncbi:hypothetical protein MTBSS4_190065 [Magnetospirillum sp. SS-4]|nr:hypothetical protein MTBSS4_190065 [Magnetospirillum sp. SS-4]
MNCVGPSVLLPLLPARLVQWNEGPDDQDRCRRNAGAGRFRLRVRPGFLGEHEEPGRPTAGLGLGNRRGRRDGDAGDAGGTGGLRLLRQLPDGFRRPHGGRLGYGQG